MGETKELTVGKSVASLKMVPKVTKCAQHKKFVFFVASVIPLISPCKIILKVLGVIRVLFKD